MVGRHRAAFDHKVWLTDDIQAYQALRCHGNENNSLYHRETGELSKNESTLIVIKVLEKWYRPQWLQEDDDEEQSAQCR